MDQVFRHGTCVITRKGKRKSPEFWRIWKLRVFRTAEATFLSKRLAFQEEKKIPRLESIADKAYEEESPWRGKWLHTLYSGCCQPNISVKYENNRIMRISFELFFLMINMKQNALECWESVWWNLFGYLLNRCVEDLFLPFFPFSRWLCGFFCL